MGFYKFSSLVLTLSLLVAVAGQSRAQDEEVAAASGDDKIWSIEIDSTFNSKYIWRGQNLTDGAVWQPSGTLGVEVGDLGTLSFNVWGNMDITDANDNDGEFNEIDYTADFSWSYKLLSFSHGVIFYDFPNTDFDSTLEIYNSIGLEIPVEDWYPITTAITWYQDVDEADGAYVTFSLGHDIPIELDSDAISLALSLGASVAWGSSDYNEFYFGVDDGAMNDLLLSLGLPIGIGDHFTVTPAIAYSYLLDSDIQDAVDEESNVFGGVSLTFAF